MPALEPEPARATRRRNAPAALREEHMLLLFLFAGGLMGLSFLTSAGPERASEPPLTSSAARELLVERVPSAWNIQPIGLKAAATSPVPEALAALAD